MRKSQQTLEFFLVYGWALLIIFMLVLAISYFDIFDFSKLLPDLCDFSNGLDCYAVQASSSNQEVDVQFRNVGSARIIVNDAQIMGSASGCFNVTNTTINSGSFPQFVSRNTLFTIGIKCDAGLRAGRRYQANMEVRYTRPDTGENLTSIGRIRQKIS